MSDARWKSLTILIFAGTAACGPSTEHARADSVLQLNAQKDSLTRVVLQADDFIMQIDSTVSHAVATKNKKGKGSRAQLDPLAQQLLNRKAVMARVDALVQRTQATARQLAQANKDNTELRSQLASDSAMIADLTVTIHRQTATIDALSTRVDSLNGVTRELGASLATLEAQHNKAFYVIGREDDLVKRGVVVREGGANLLFAHPGRTLQISRSVDPDVFTAVDQRGTREIRMPDSTAHYRVVSRQSLDFASVGDRDNESFTGNLRITDPGKFWAPSRFLVIVQQ
jgi:uncharacterized coiled-coil protein SlyX